jgi:Tfp pilus assembly protein PilX
MNSPSSFIKVARRRNRGACPTARAQKGATLLVALIMLVMVTLFALTAVNISSVNLKIVGNMQSRQAVEMVATSAIEHTLSDVEYFYNSSSPVGFTAPEGMTVAVGNRQCLSAFPATGYSAVVAIAPEDTVWEVPVVVEDTLTNSTVTMTQGVGIRMLAGNCPS